MPYIPNKRREVLDQYVNGLADYIKETNLESSWLGDTNYVITRLLMRLVQTFGPMRYWMAVSLLGTLEAVKIEIFRRAIGPYENKQQEINGDVPEFIPPEEIEMPSEPRRPRGQLED